MGKTHIAKDMHIRLSVRLSIHAYRGTINDIIARHCVNHKQGNTNWTCISGGLSVRFGEKRQNLDAAIYSIKVLNGPLTVGLPFSSITRNQPALPCQLELYAQSEVLRSGRI